MAAEQMIALVLERCAGQPDAADWRMLADILATRRELSHRAAARAEAVLTAGHARMTAETRVEVARAIGPGCRSAGLVGLFCRGTLGEAMPLLTGKEGWGGWPSSLAVGVPPLGFVCFKKA